MPETTPNRGALRVVQSGALAIVLAAATYKLFELDRYFVPKGARAPSHRARRHHRVCAGSAPPRAHARRKPLRHLSPFRIHLSRSRHEPLGGRARSRNHLFRAHHSLRGARDLRIRGAVASTCRARRRDRARVRHVAAAGVRRHERLFLAEPLAGRNVRQPQFRRASRRDRRARRCSCCSCSIVERAEYSPRAWVLRSSPPRSCCRAVAPPCSR